jgi:hypothetical protein
MKVVVVGYGVSIPSQSNQLSSPCPSMLLVGWCTPYFVDRHILLQGREKLELGP